MGFQFFPHICVQWAVASTCWIDATDIRLLLGSSRPTENSLPDSLQWHSAIQTGEINEETHRLPDGALWRMPTALAQQLEVHFTLRGSAAAGDAWKEDDWITRILGKSFGRSRRDRETHFADEFGLRRVWIYSRSLPEEESWRWQTCSLTYHIVGAQIVFDARRLVDWQRRSAK